MTPRPSQLGHGLGELGQQALADALAGHLDQTELGDVEHLGAGLVPRQRVAEALDDLRPVVADLHVDEVDHDDAADVAQPELLGDLLGRLHVVVEDRLLEVRRADVLAGVDVDHRQRLGVLDDQRAARRQPHLAVERLVDLLVDVVLLEQRQPLGGGVVVLDPVGELGVERRARSRGPRRSRRWSSITTPRYSALNSSRITRTASSGSRYSSVGAGGLRPPCAAISVPLVEQQLHVGARARASVACSAAVRTIRPCSAGLTRSRMSRRRLRTSSGRRLEMP